MNQVIARTMSLCSMSYEFIRIWKCVEVLPEDWDWWCASSFRWKFVPFVYCLFLLLKDGESLHCGGFCLSDIEKNWLLFASNLCFAVECDFILKKLTLPYLTSPYLTLPSGWAGCYTCPALRPYQFGPMRRPDVTRRSQWSAVKPNKSPATWDWWRVVWLFLSCGLRLVSSSPSD